MKLGTGSDVLSFDFTNFSPLSFPAKFTELLYVYFAGHLSASQEIGLLLFRRKIAKPVSILFHI